MKDRRDAKKVKNVDPMHKILVHLKPNRCDSDVYINKKMDVTKLVEYIEEKKKDDNTLTYFHAFVTLIGKTIFNRPLLNRFIINKTLYDRNHVSIGFVAKVNYDDESKEMMSLIEIEENDNIMTLQKKLTESVTKIRKNKEEGTNNLVSIIGKLPKFLLSIVVSIVKFMDRHDLLPKSLINENIYFSSVIVSNLGSIKSGAIYHNLTDFGTSSILCTIGEIKEEKVLIDGKEEIRKICEFGINIDERIADGVYFVKSIALMQDILNNPELLEKKVSEKVSETTKYKY